MILGYSYTFLRGYDQNSMPAIVRGDQLSLRREVFRVGQPAVAACLGRRVVGRIHLDEAREYDGLLEELPRHQIKAIAVITDITQDHHRRQNGARYQYTRIDIEIKYRTKDTTNTYNKLYALLEDVALEHGVATGAAEDHGYGRTLTGAAEDH